MNSAYSEIIRFNIDQSHDDHQASSPLHWICCGEVVGRRLVAYCEDSDKIKDDEDEKTEDAKDSGGDVERSGCGGVMLGPTRVSELLPIPGLDRKQKSEQSQAAEVAVDKIENGPHQVIFLGLLRGLNIHHCGLWL